MSVVRAALRILFCLTAWLMLSPVAIATPPCDRAPEVAVAMECCDADEACGLPMSPTESPCDECGPMTLPLAATAATPDIAPPLPLLAELPPVLEIEASPALAPAAALFHPPPPTLLSLGTMLTC